MSKIEKGISESSKSLQESEEAWNLVCSRGKGKKGEGLREMNLTETIK